MKNNSSINILNSAILILFGIAGDGWLYFNSINTHSWPIYFTWVSMIGIVFILSGLIMLFFSLVSIVIKK